MDRQPPNWEELGVAGSLARCYREDSQSFLELLVSVLRSASPETVVTYPMALFGKRPPSQITFPHADFVYRLINHRGTLRAERDHVVRGIRLKSDTLPMEAWLTEVGDAVKQDAQSAQHAYQAIRKFVE